MEMTHGMGENRSHWPHYGMCEGDKMSMHLLAQKLAQTSSSRTWSSTTVSPTFLSLTEARNGCHNSGARCSNTAAPTSDSHVHITRRQTGSANALYAPSLTPCVAAWTALTKHGMNILTPSSSLSTPPCRHPRASLLSKFCTATTCACR